MHNLHLAVIKANSPKEACIAVETETSSWGDENNWRSIGGCVSDKDEVYVSEEDARYYPDEDWNTIEKLNKLVLGWADNNKKEFNILKDTLCPWDFSDCGITQFGGYGKQQYVVFIDMHS